VEEVWTLCGPMKGGFGHSLSSLNGTFEEICKRAMLYEEE